jgi:hypothetical protein
MKDRDLNLLQEAYTKVYENTQADPEALRAHIKAKNDKTRAWIAEDPENRGAGLAEEDPEFWKEYNIYTPQDFDHYGLVSTVFEMIRDRHGYKPHWGKLMQMSDEELQAEIDRESRIIRQEEEEERQRQEQEQRDKEELKQKRQEARKPLDNSLGRALDKINK